MQGIHLRKYGVATTINFELYQTDGINLKTDAAHASGDTKIMKNEGAEANTASAFVDRGQGYSLALSATEMQAARIVIYVVDQGTKVWLDKVICIETYGNASAAHAFDLGTAMSSQAVASVSGAVGSVTGAVGSVTGNVGGNVTGSVGSVVGNVGGNVVGSVASVSGAVGSVTGNVGGNVNGTVASVVGNVGGNVSGSVASVVATVSADVVSVSGDSAAADNLEADYDGTGYNKANSTIGTCTVNSDMRGTDGALLAANVNVSAGVVEANLKQIDGQATNGNNASLKLKQLDVQNNAGSAIIAKSTGSNGIGLDVAGNGSGQGLLIVGGTSAEGGAIRGGTTAGVGLQIQAMGGNSQGLFIAGYGNQSAIEAQGGATGHGAYFKGGSTSGDGIRSQATLDGKGASFLAVGANPGLYASGGTNGSGAQFVGIGTAHGVDMEAGSNGNGLYAKGGQQAGAKFDGDGAPGLLCVVGSGCGNSPAMRLTSLGTVTTDLDGEVDIGAVKGVAVTGVADFKADVSALATAANLATLDGKVDTVDTVVDAIKLKTDNLPADPATVTNQTAIEGKVDTAITDIAGVKGVVDAIVIDTAEIGVAGAGLTDLGGMSTAMKAQVNAEVLDVFTVDTIAELAAIPAANAPLSDKLNLVSMAVRNGMVHNRATGALQVNKDDTTALGTCTVTDTGGATGTLTRPKFA